MIKSKDCLHEEDLLRTHWEAQGGKDCSCRYCEPDRIIRKLIAVAKDAQTIRESIEYSKALAKLDRSLDALEQE